MSLPLMPVRGDIVIRGTLDSGFSVVHAVTDRPIGNIGLTLHDAIAIAQAKVAGGEIWQQHLDGRGRPIGPAFRLPK